VSTNDPWAPTAPTASRNRAAEERAAAQRAADAELFEQLTAEGFKGARFGMLQDRL
jgi:hypothetical protein